MRPVTRDSSRAQKQNVSESVRKARASILYVHRPQTDPSCKNYGPLAYAESSAQPELSAGAGTSAGKKRDKLQLVSTEPARCRPGQASR